MKERGNVKRGEGVKKRSHQQESSGVNEIKKHVVSGRSAQGQLGGGGGGVRYSQLTDMRKRRESNITIYIPTFIFF